MTIGAFRKEGLDRLVEFALVAPVGVALPPHRASSYEKVRRRRPKSLRARATKSLDLGVENPDAVDDVLA